MASSSYSKSIELYIRAKLSAIENMRTSLHREWVCEEVRIMQIKPKFKLEVLIRHTVSNTC